VANHATEPRFRRVLLIGSAFAVALVGYLVFNGLQVNNLTDARNSERSQKHSAEATISAQATVASKGLNLAGQLEGLCRTDKQFRAEHAGFCTQASQLATAQVTLVPGPPGVSGAQGAQGPPGAAGSPGSPGPAGSNGASGQPGSNGGAGSPGASGASGLPGAPGLPGDPGDQGPKGDQGSQGPVGDTGPAGAAGADPSDIDFDFTVPANGPLDTDHVYHVHCPWDHDTKKYDTCVVVQQ
jgi:hypothetical protein